MANKEKGKGSRGLNLKNNLLAGLLVVIPAGLVIFALFWLFSHIDNALQPVIKALTGRDIVGAGIHHSSNRHIPGRIDDEKHYRPRYRQIR